MAGGFGQSFAFQAAHHALQAISGGPVFVVFIPSGAGVAGHGDTGLDRLRRLLRLRGQKIRQQLNLLLPAQAIGAVEEEFVVDDFRPPAVIGEAQRVVPAQGGEKN